MQWFWNDKKFKKGWKDFTSDIQSAWNTLTGKNEEKHATRAEELAEQSEKFNEQYSADQLAESARQFDINNETANRNIDFQKDIAEKNLALQQDAFNAQLRENEITRQREDTAYQRQVADLKAAGFSPLMASNGAGAASMSVGAAPQYDVSGVSSAQGSALDLAREYAELRNMIKGQYITRKQAAQNARIGAMQALSDLSFRRRQNFENLALQTFNTAVNTKKTLSDIAINKGTFDWNIAHGFRNQNTWSVLLPVLDKLADNLGIDYDKLKDVVTSIPGHITNITNKIDSLYEGTPESFEKLKDTVGVLKDSSISKDNYDFLLSFLIDPRKQQLSKDKLNEIYESMNDKFKDRFKFNVFSQINTSKLVRSSIYKYLMFGY